MLRVACLSAVVVGLAGGAQAEHPVPFDVRLLYIDANEGCDIADVDGDGRLDVVAGRNWFRNPEWIARPLRQFDDLEPLTGGDESRCTRITSAPARCRVDFDVRAADGPNRVLVVRRGDEQANWRLD